MSSEQGGQELAMHSQDRARVIGASFQLLRPGFFSRPHGHAIGESAFCLLNVGDEPAIHLRVTLGRVGPKPVGQTPRNLQLNLDWPPPLVEGVSLNLGIVSTGDRTARRDNRVDIPARTLVDVVARHRFKLGGKPAQLRVSVSNLFDIYGYNLRGSGSYDIIAGRVAQASLAVDLR